MLHYMKSQRVGHVKSRLNIGWRVGPRARAVGGGCHHSHFVSPTGNQNLPPAPTGGHPELSGNRLVCLFNQGTFAIFTLFSLFDSDCLFLGCSVGVFVQCFYTSNCVILTTAHDVCLSLASCFKAAFYFF